MTYLLFYKNKEDREYALQLFQKVIINEDELSEEIDGKTPNWDQERIAEIDMIILKMGISEFLFFPFIPVRVTINEYLEVSKEYSSLDYSEGYGVDCRPGNIYKKNSLAKLLNGSIKNTLITQIK